MSNEDTILAEMLGENTSDSGNAAKQDPIEPTEEVKREGAEQPSFNFKEMFGDQFESADSVKSALDKLKMYEGIDLNEIEGLRQKTQEYQRIIDNPEQPKFKESKYLKLDRLEATEPDKASIYSGIILGNPDNYSVARMKILYENPELAEDPELIDFKLKKQYPDLFNPDLESDSDEYKVAQKELELSAKTFKSFIKRKFDEVQIEDESDSKPKDNSEFVQKWSSPFKQLHSEVSEIGLKMTGPDGNLVDLAKVAIPAEKRRELLSQAAKFIHSSGIEPSDESVETVKKFMHNLYIASNLPQVLRDVVKSVTEKSEQEIMGLIHNEGKLKGSASDRSNQPSVNDEDETVENIYNGK